MKPICAFTIADKNNINYAMKLKNSLKKFHPDVPLIIYGEGELAKIKDPQKFYRATPLFARELIKEYELVVKIDADSIITGDLSHIFDDKSYDVGCVLNNNAVNSHVVLQGIPPNYYVNCGFVAMRSKRFVDNWWNNCNRFYFNHFQYREQDLLNILVYHGDYEARVFDHSTPYWHGLIANGHRPQFEIIDDGGTKIVVDIPMSENQVVRKEIKVYHAAGGNVVYKPGTKLDFNLYFQPEVADYMNYLASDEK